MIEYLDFKDWKNRQPDQTIEYTNLVIQCPNKCKGQTLQFTLIDEDRKGIGRKMRVCSVCGIKTMETRNKLFIVGEKDDKKRD